MLKAEERRQNRVRRRTRLAISAFMANETNKLKPEHKLVFQHLLEDNNFLDEALDHIEDTSNDNETISVMASLRTDREPRDWKGFFRRIGQALLRIMPYLIELLSILVPSIAPLLGVIQKPIEGIITHLPDPGTGPAPVTA